MDSVAVDDFFDLPALLKRFRGNRDFVIKLLTVFEGDALLRRDNILKAQDKAALPELRNAAHAMKGAALDVSAGGLGDLAARLEHLAINADLGPIAQTVAELQLLVERAVACVPRAIDRVRNSQ